MKRKNWIVGSLMLCSVSYIPINHAARNQADSQSAAAQAAGSQSAAAQSAGNPSDAVQSSASQSAESPSAAQSASGKSAASQSTTQASSNSASANAGSKTAWAESQQSKDRSNYFLIQGASSGSIERVPGQANVYKITLKNITPYVSYLSDRPNRKAGQITVAEYLSLWLRKGKNSFKANPPNAILHASQYNSSQSSSPEDANGAQAASSADGAQAAKGADFAPARRKTRAEADQNAIAAADASGADRAQIDLRKKRRAEADQNATATANGSMEAAANQPLYYAFEIYEPRYDSKSQTLIYQAKPLAGNSAEIPASATLEHITLFIDEVCIGCWDD